MSLTRVSSGGTCVLYVIAMIWLSLFVYYVTSVFEMVTYC